MNWLAHWAVALGLTLTGAPEPHIKYGIDRLDEYEVASQLAGKQLAVLTHAAAISMNGEHLLRLLYPKYAVRRVLSPEHGLDSTADVWVGDGIDANTGLHVTSLYKSKQSAPDTAVLKGIDAIVIDLQDVGVRYYTYIATIAHVMRVAASCHVEVILLDRPNVLGGRLMEGEVLDAALAGALPAYMQVPTRHGMTLGELAGMLNVEAHMGAKLTVIPVTGWQGERVLFSAARPFVPPSPALVTREQVGLYNLWGALETLNLGVGRGMSNDEAFRVIGAPWLGEVDAQKLAAALNALRLGEVCFFAHAWTATRTVFAGEHLWGVRVQWSGAETPSDAFLYQVTQTLVRFFSDRLVISERTAAHFGSQAMVDAIRQGTPWAQFKLQIEARLAAFAERRRPYLLYPRAG